ncbi:unnamed protein product, partial [Ectocarpus sp. 8 AP-2014]
GFPASSVPIPLAHSLARLPAEEGGIVSAAAAKSIPTLSRRSPFAACTPAAPLLLLAHARALLSPPTPPRRSGDPPPHPAPSTERDESRRRGTPPLLFSLRATDDDAFLSGFVTAAAPAGSFVAVALIPMALARLDTCTPAAPLELRSRRFLLVATAPRPLRRWPSPAARTELTLGLRCPDFPWARGAASDE